MGYEEGATAAWCVRGTEPLPAMSGMTRPRCPLSEGKAHGEQTENRDPVLDLTHLCLCELMSP